MQTLYQTMKDTVPRCETPQDLKGRALTALRAEESSLSCTEPVIPNTLRIGVQEVKIKEPLNLHCSASGIPTPDITWYGPNNEEIGANEDQKYELFIPQVHESDLGEYKCKAKNFKGEDSFTVVVKKKETSAYEEHEKSYYDDDDDDLEDFGKDGDIESPDNNEYDDDDEDYLEDDPNCPEECYCEESFVDCQDLDVSEIPSMTQLIFLICFSAHNITPNFGTPMFSRHDSFLLWSFQVKH